MLHTISKWRTLWGHNYESLSGMKGIYKVLLCLSTRQTQNEECLANSMHYLREHSLRFSSPWQSINYSFCYIIQPVSPQSGLDIKKQPIKIQVLKPWSLTQQESEVGSWKVTRSGRQTLFMNYVNRPLGVGTTLKNITHWEHWHTRYLGDLVPSPSLNIFPIYSLSLHTVSVCVYIYVVLYIYIYFSFYIHIFCWYTSILFIHVTCILSIYNKYWSHTHIQFVYVYIL